QQVRLKIEDCRLEIGDWRSETAANLQSICNLQSSIFNLTNTLLSHQVCRILFVVADLFNQLSVRKQIERHSESPGFQVRLRVVDGELNFHMPEVAPPVAFDEMQGVGGRVPAKIEPVVLTNEPPRVHDQCIAFPLANRVPHPAAIEIRRKQTAVGEDLAIVIEFLVEDYDQSRRLDDLGRLGD